MFRVSFVFLALASALTLNGCSQCSNPGAETGTPAATEMAPTATPAAEVAPVAPAAPTDAAAPAEGATPADASAPAATPAH